MVYPKQKLQRLQKQFGEKIETFYYPFTGKLSLVTVKLPGGRSKLIEEFKKTNNPGKDEPQIQKLAYVTNFMSITNYTFLDPDLIKQFFQKELKGQYKRFTKFFFLDLFLKEGILFLTGEPHSKVRKILQQIFNFQNLQKNFEIQKNAVKNVFQQIEEFNEKESLRPKDQPQKFIPLFDLGKSFTGQTVSGFLMDDNYDKKELYKGQTIMNSVYGLVQSIFGIDSKSVFYQIKSVMLSNVGTMSVPDFILCDREKKIKKELLTLRGFFQDILKKRRQEFEQNEKQGCNDILQLLLRQELEDTKKIKREETDITEEKIIQAIFTLLIGGLDTTAIFIVVSSYMLARHPDIQEKIRGEYKEKFGEKTYQELEVSDINKLKIIDNFGKEVSRMYPSLLETVTHQCTKPHTVGEFKIEKGDFVNVGILQNHYSKFFYENPEEFNIERWENPHPDFTPLVHLPFGVGPSSCIGQFFAMNQWKVLTLAMVLNYQLKLNEDCTDFHQIWKSFGMPSRDDVVEFIKI